MKNNPPTLLKGSILNLYFLIAIASTIITIALLPKSWWKFVPLVFCFFVIVAVVTAAKKIIRTDEEKHRIRQLDWEKERVALRSELAEAKRDKFSEDLGRQVEDFVRNLTANEITFFKALLKGQDWDGTSIVDYVPLEEQRKARDKGVAAKIMFNDEEKWHRCGRTRPYWKIYPDFIAALKKFLYS